MLFSPQHKTSGIVISSVGDLDRRVLGCAVLGSPQYFDPAILLAGSPIDSGPQDPDHIKIIKLRKVFIHSAYRAEARERLNADDIVD